MSSPLQVWCNGMMPPLMQSFHVLIGLETALYVSGSTLMVLLFLIQKIPVDVPLQRWFYSLRLRKVFLLVDSVLIMYPRLRQLHSLNMSLFILLHFGVQVQEWARWTYGHRGVASVFAFDCMAAGRAAQGIGLAHTTCRCIDVLEPFSIGSPVAMSASLSSSMFPVIKAMHGMKLLTRSAGLHYMDGFVAWTLMPSVSIMLLLTMMLSIGCGIGSALMMVFL